LLGHAILLWCQSSDGGIGFPVMLHSIPLACTMRDRFVSARTLLMAVNTSSGERPTVNELV
jgi:hypothetical protein